MIDKQTVTFELIILVHNMNLGSASNDFYENKYAGGFASDISI